MHNLLNTVFPVTIAGHRLYRVLNRIIVEPIYGDEYELREFDTWSQALDYIDHRNGNIPGGEW